MTLSVYKLVNHVLTLDKMNLLVQAQHNLNSEDNETASSYEAEISKTSK